MTKKKTPKKNNEPESQLKKEMSSKDYYSELEKLEIELVKLQEWVKYNGLKVVVLFEGRDAAGKGGVIKTIAGCMNPRICRIVALGVPTEKEKSQWYFQRYVSQLPSGGEISFHSFSSRSDHLSPSGASHLERIRPREAHIPEGQRLRSRE